MRFTSLSNVATYKIVNINQNDKILENHVFVYNEL